MSINIKVGGKGIFVTPTGVKVGSKGRVMKPGVLFGSMDRKAARKLRKELRAAGHAGLAAHSRLAA